MYLIYFIFFSLAPGVLWLLFFFREDVQPESTISVLRVFLLGVLSALPVIIIGFSIRYIMKLLEVPSAMATFINIVLVASIVEEIIKYLVVKGYVLNNSSCDEPTDIMLYAITAAMGFATLENLLFLSPGFMLGATRDIFIGSLVRFISGTFLHALATGIMGYFLALSIMKTKYRKRLVSLGLGIAILLHALYNFSIIKAGYSEWLFIIAPIILIASFVVIFICFSKTRKMISICEINIKK